MQGERKGRKKGNKWEAIKSDYSVQKSFLSVSCIRIQDFIHELVLIHKLYSSILIYKWYFRYRIKKKSTEAENTRPISWNI